jgi:antirestriction protein ArdC
MTKQDRRDLYEEVTQRVVDALDAGTVPWSKPWRAGIDAHRNPVSGTIYRGVNPMLLEMSAMSQGFSDPRWMTFKQARSKGGAVRKGSQGTTVVFWKTVPVKGEDADGNVTKKAVPMLRHYTVFNVEQIDGLDLEPLEDADYTFEPTPSAEDILGGYFGREGAPRLRWGGDSAFYAPVLDMVNLPDRERFTSVRGFYGTAFHEAVHSTGHKDRLARKEITGTLKFGDEPYGREELCAEMGAAMLCGMAGLVEIEQSAAYVKHWRDAISADNRMVILAAQRAQKAADLILGV